MTNQKYRKCISCFHGEIDQNADLRVKGRNNGVPYRGWLCIDHYNMMLDDGAEIRPVEWVKRKDQN
jgi:hypothetical protein